MRHNFTLKKEENFRTSLTKTTWVEVNKDRDAEMTYQSFMNILTILCKECFPYVQRKKENVDRHRFTPAIITSSITKIVYIITFIYKVIYKSYTIQHFMIQKAQESICQNGLKSYKDVLLKDW